MVYIADSKILRPQVKTSLKASRASLDDPDYTVEEEPAFLQKKSPEQRELERRERDFHFDLASRLRGA